MAKILVGVSGGISAYKACELVRLFVKAGHEVTPVLTPAAESFVSYKTFNALARRSRGDGPYPHIERADLFARPGARDERAHVGEPGDTGEYARAARARR
jgi:3-polyprenyl-4-hydroxybenzoate decarboxylase